MTSPTNTAGLEVVAWEYRFSDTRPWHRTENPKTAEEERQDGSEVRPYAVTAASAQAAIDGWVRWADERLQEAQAETLSAMKERDAAEARADRLAGAARNACDLLAERTCGHAARSPGHNARLVLEYALQDQPNTSSTTLKGADQ